MKQLSSVEALGEYRLAENARPTSSITMSLAEVADVLGIHRTTAWSLHKRGELPVPVLKVGSNLRVVRAHLQLFLMTGEPVAPGTRVDASMQRAS